MKYIFSTEVRGYELDSYGHVNNAVYLNYAEQARWKILNDKALLSSFTSKELLLIVTETNIRYKRELKIFDQVKIETVVKFNPPYLVFNHDIINTSANCKSAKVEVKTLLIDKDRVPQDMPDELLSILI